MAGSEVLGLGDRVMDARYLSDRVRGTGFGSGSGLLSLGGRVWRAVSL